MVGVKKWPGFLLCASIVSAASNLPVVDLGYERHRAIAYNVSGRYFNFTNIRYGEPPVGPLRFAAPVPAKDRSSEVVDGSQGHICPQVFPCWFNVQTGFTDAYLAGKPFDFDAAVDSTYANPNCRDQVAAAALNPLESEDCLFLDVIVPDFIFRNRTRSKGAAVLVYVFGGGYVGGSKNAADTSGLIASSMPEGIIYVGINYRLGAMGWMFGSDFRDAGGLVNAGLHDQRLALRWVQKYIHLFGGDPSRVTIMGESAGGGSVLMQLTAYGGREKAPFQQAITQSAAWEPASVGPKRQNKVYHQFLQLLNVSTLEEARKLPSEAIIRANHILIASAPYGTGYFGPVVDGTFVPDDPKRVLLHGKTDRTVKLLTTYAANEGLRFAPGNITTADMFKQYVDFFLDSANETVRQYVIDHVYPPIFDGSLPYRSHLERADLFWAELVSTCNARYMHEAAHHPGYRNEFDVTPALHQGDIPYVFWNGPGSNPTVNQTVARFVQNYITSFTMTGNPNRRGTPYLKISSGDDILDMSEYGFAQIHDQTMNPRCDYWQNAPYQPYIDWDVGQNGTQE